MRERARAGGRSGRHLLGLINDVLDLSKIEAGQLVLALADYSMKEIVEAVSRLLDSLAVEKRLALAVDLAPDLPTGRGDQRRLTQVAAEPGRQRDQVHRGKAASACRWQLRAPRSTSPVRDTGPGIADGGPGAYLRGVPAG